MGRMLRPRSPAFRACVIPALALGIAGCALFRKKPAPEPPPAPTSRLTAPYPEGYEYEDLRSFFHRRDVPAAKELERCDFDYQVERRLSPGKEGLFTTFPEHVKAEPNAFHWCFYHKLFRILDAARTPAREAEARRRIVEDYPFITHVARIFQADFGEVRYLRAAVYQYKKLSRSLYFVGVAPSGRTAQELMDPQFPEGLPGVEPLPSPTLEP